MKQILNELLSLNIEIEGALRVLIAHDSIEARSLLSDKYSAFEALYNKWSDAQPTNEAPLAPPAFEPASESVTEPTNEPVDEPTVADEPADEPAAPAPVAAPESEAPVTEPEHTVYDTTLVEVLDASASDEDTLIAKVTEATSDDTLIAKVPEPESIADAHAAPASIADSIATAPRLDEILAKKSSRDLSKAFTINDKFRFIRGLFCEDKNDFDYTVARLSDLQSLDEAYDFLLNELGWDIDNEEVKDFMLIVNNHFNTNS